MLNCHERNNGRGLNVTKAEQCAAMGVTAMCGFVINPWAAIGALLLSNGHAITLQSPKPDAVRP